jgi:hypothetical protein
LNNLRRICSGTQRHDGQAVARCGKPCDSHMDHAEARGLVAGSEHRRHGLRHRDLRLLLRELTPYWPGRNSGCCPPPDAVVVAGCFSAPPQQPLGRGVLRCPACGSPRRATLLWEAVTADRNVHTSGIVDAAVVSDLA